jgi:hypothetical protein
MYLTNSLEDTEDIDNFLNDSSVSHVYSVQ